MQRAPKPGCSRGAHGRVPARRATRERGRLRVRAGPRSAHGRMRKPVARGRLLRSRGACGPTRVLVSFMPGRRASRRRLRPVRCRGGPRVRWLRRAGAFSRRERALLLRASRRHVPPRNAQSRSELRAGPLLPSGHAARLGLVPCDRNRDRDRDRDRGARRPFARRRRCLDGSRPRDRWRRRVGSPLPSPVSAASPLRGRLRGPPPGPDRGVDDAPGPGRERAQRPSLGDRRERSATAGGRRDAGARRSGHDARAFAQPRRRVERGRRGGARALRDWRALSETGAGSRGRVIRDVREAAHTRLRGRATLRLTLVNK
jgi:hypothetical protein